MESQEPESQELGWPGPQFLGPEELKILAQAWMAGIDLGQCRGQNQELREPEQSEFLDETWFPQPEGQRGQGERGCLGQGTESR